MENNNNKGINRRNFLKTLGAGSAVTAAALAGCKPRNTVSAEGGSIGEVPTDKMTYRINPHTGDKVSLLGYGCMRWPVRKKADGSGEEVDQDTVNELVDYAIAHGVNLFDTAPVYVRGWSETATGIALKRHPRDKFLSQQSCRILVITARALLNRVRRCTRNPCAICRLIILITIYSMVSEWEV